MLVELQERLFPFLVNRRCCLDQLPTAPPAAWETVDEYLLVPGPWSARPRTGFRQQNSNLVPLPVAPLFCVSGDIAVPTAQS